MTGTSIRELGEEGSDGRPYIGGARLLTRFRDREGRGGRGRVRGGDGLLPGLGRFQLVQQGLYAIWVLEEGGEGIVPGLGAYTYLRPCCGCGISCALWPEKVGWGVVTPLIAWLRPGPVSNPLVLHVSATTPVPPPSSSRSGLTALSAPRAF